MATEHLMYCGETNFTAGTWGGAVITGFAVRCGNCELCFCVGEHVIVRAGSIYTVKSVCDLTCPYCGTKAHTKPEQERIIEDTSRWGGED